jgi:hypothetical protein
MCPKRLTLQIYKLRDLRLRIRIACFRASTADLLEFGTGRMFDLSYFDNSFLSIATLLLIKLDSNFQT